MFCGKKAGKEIFEQWVKQEKFDQSTRITGKKSLF